MVTSSPIRQRINPVLKWLILILLLGGLLLACDEEAVETAEATSRPKSTRTPTAVKVEQATQAPAETKPSGERQWTIMLYQDADDEILEEDIFTDLNEAELVGSSDDVAIISQIDRFKGGFKGDGNWTGARRYYVTQDDDLNKINSEKLDDLGEVNMADTQVLKDFVTWAVKTYPAEKYVLILSDHGSGWPGGFTDGSNTTTASGAEQIEGFGDMIYLNELDQALADIQQETGIDQFELIGLDACLMGQVEVLSALQPYAHYAVLSQETEPGLGWAYASFLKKAVQEPETDGAALGTKIVDSYITDDTIITNDSRRAEYIKENYDNGEDLSAAQLAVEEIKPTTLALIDLTKIPELLTSVDDLAQAMTGINQKMVARARSRAITFESVFGEDYPSPYIDLGNFAKLIKSESTSPKVGSAADAVRSAINAAVIKERHGSEKKGATGVSIYFPNSNLFKEDGSDYKTYTLTADRFSDSSLWADFLTFHYTGQPLAKNNAPKSRAVVKGPGAEKLKISPLKLSANSLLMDETITVSSKIEGENLAYVYFFTGYIQKGDKAIHVLDIDYIDSDATLEMDGVTYPDWGEERPVDIEVDWEAVQYVIESENSAAAALLEPQVYAADLANTIYTSNGIYTSADTGEKRYVRLFFNGDGELTQIIGFTGMDDTGPQRQLSPVVGDEITMLERWMETAPDGTMQQTKREGETVVIGEKELTWSDTQAPKGQYVVGIMVEDMDGNLYSQYANVTVK